MKRSPRWYRTGLSIGNRSPSQVWGLLHTRQRSQRWREWARRRCQGCCQLRLIGLSVCGFGGERIINVPAMTVMGGKKVFGRSPNQCERYLACWCTWSPGIWQCVPDLVGWLVWWAAESIETTCLRQSCGRQGKDLKNRCAHDKYRPRRPTIVWSSTSHENFKWGYSADI